MASAGVTQFVLLVVCAMTKQAASQLQRTPQNAEFLPVGTVEQARAESLWWGMARFVDLSSGGNLRDFPSCSSIPFSPLQKRFCERDRNTRNHDLMRVLARASLATSLECERQFQEARWNCPRFRQGPLFGRSILLEATKESSFVHALMSASVAHEAAQACSKGLLPTHCQCSRLDPTKIKYPEKPEPKTSQIVAPCPYGDNIHYGRKVALDFLELTKHSKWDKFRLALNKHNRRVGIRAVEKEMEVRCKCHGFSGTCGTQTCWQSLPNFKKIGNFLKQAYRSARVADFHKPWSAEGNAETNRTSAELPSLRLSPKKSEDHLQYRNESMSYCTARPDLDILGTRGRNCVTTAAEGSCNQMCCGRGYNNFKETVDVTCRCRFIWCCRVHCDVCQQTLEQSQCK